MGILNRDEIERRLEKGELSRYARRKNDGRFDIEPASYDLTAGKAVWKEPIKANSKGVVETRSYNPGRPIDEQLTVSVAPGQMIFVITQEDILMPVNLCGGVYLRNNLAREGILALNAGHVDPGFEGPIVIRLINLRATTWTLTLGTPIFTIVFQTLDVSPADKLVTHHAIPADDTLLKVRNSADAALSNALFDLYALEMEVRLYEHYASVEQRIRSSLSQEFLKRNEFGSPLFIKIWSSLWKIIVILILIIGLLPYFSKVVDFIQQVSHVSSTPTGQPQSPDASPVPAKSPTPPKKGSGTS